MSLIPVGTTLGAIVAPLAIDTAAQIIDQLDFRRLLAEPHRPTTADHSPEAPFVGLNELHRQRAELKGEIDQLTKQFQERFSDIFKSAGIDRTTEIRLQDDGFGRLIVQGDHPQRAAIEQLLEQNPDLAARFRQLFSKVQQLSQTDPSQVSIPQDLLHSLQEASKQSISDLLDFEVAIAGDQVSIQRRD